MAATAMATILLLPYYLFRGQLFIGGDDSRLCSMFPEACLENVAFFSWFHFASVGQFNPAQFLIPQLLAVKLGEYVLPNLVVHYLFLSAPALVGFVYFRKLVLALFRDKPNTHLPAATGASLYVLSPILLVTQWAVFSHAVWLVALVPALGYYLIKYVADGALKHCLAGACLSCLLSVAVFSIPWLLGALVPILLGALSVISLVSRPALTRSFRRVAVFVVIVFGSQLFWLVSFIAEALDRNRASYLGQAFSEEQRQTFGPIVMATSIGNNIIYPVLNLFHRQIAFDFQWPSRTAFSNFYDITVWLNVVYPLVTLAGLSIVVKRGNRHHKMLALGFTVAFMAALFLVTVNIGPLRPLFLALGNLPGFVMFRNFADKFALGYVLVYAALISCALVSLGSSSAVRQTIACSLVLGVTALNLVPVRKLLNGGIWTAEAVQPSGHIGSEYASFLAEVKRTVPSTSTVLSLPFNVAGYSIVVDHGDSRQAYVGRSPLQILIGRWDLAGDLSLLPKDAQLLRQLLLARDYAGINVFLHDHDVGYIVVTRNIPSALLKSYLYDKSLMRVQDDHLLRAISGDLIQRSSFGSYELYVAKDPTMLLESPNMQFRRINPTHYRLYLHNLDAQRLVFRDTFHSGWHLYPRAWEANETCSPVTSVGPAATVECESHDTYWDRDWLPALYERTAFDQSHTAVVDGNAWWLEAKTAKQLPAQFIRSHPDGTVDMAMDLYFTPQSYFYLGLMASLGFWLALLAWCFALPIRRRSAQLCRSLVWTWWTLQANRARTRDLS